MDVTVGGSKIAIELDARRRVDVGFLDRFGPLVGSAPKMRRVFSILEKVAPTPLGILILGETGTGKELVAKAIHEASGNGAGPLVVVDCASIPPSLAESLLFGHEKGAFTGANDRRKGALAEANGGTLFLDELGELPLELQPKLLRALSEKQVKRLGSAVFEGIDARVVAATRRDLGAEMNAGRFRSDLFFRIAQVRIELPRYESASMTFPCWSKRPAAAWGNLSTPRRCSRGSSNGWCHTTGLATCASWSTWRASRRRSRASPGPSTTS